MATIQPLPTFHPTPEAVCGQEICVKIFLEKVRILPFFLLSLRAIPLEPVPLLTCSLICYLPKPGISSSEHSVRPWGFVGPFWGGNRAHRV